MLVESASPTPSVGFLFAKAEESRMKRVMSAPGDLQTADRSAQLNRLLFSISNGDRGAFAEMYDRTSAKIYGVCLRILGNESDAQDVLQDVYVTVWRKAALFDPAKAGAITWLCVLARNKSIDRSRRRELATDDLAAADGISDDRPSAFEVVQGTQEADRLRDCLDELDDQPRTMIRAAFLQGSTYPELAAREGVPLGTMKSWIRRGLQRLRGCLEQ